MYDALVVELFLVGVVSLELRDVAGCNIRGGIVCLCGVGC